MRAVLLSTALILGACSSPSIGAYPDEEGSVNLPPRRNAPSGDEDGGSSSPPAATAPSTFALTITLNGSGSVTSTPGGVTCDATSCKGTFPKGTAVTLVPTPKVGSSFSGWTGACTGTTSCAPVMNADVNLTAEFLSLAGTWSGTYTNTRDNNNCTFNNAGNLTTTITADATNLSTTAQVTGLELRFTQGCGLAGSTTGAAPASNITVAGTTMTGTWTFNVQNANGTLAFPFTATTSGKTMTGTWTCPTCKGSFTLTKQ